MPEDWEIDWKDYYEILQVHHSAEPEVIEGAYKKLVKKYHPDVNKDPAAGEKTSQINVAYKVLSDPEKRKRYHSAWFKKSGKTDGWQGATVEKPKPTVAPPYIRFSNVEPWEIKRASFIIQNVGGPYSKIWFSNPDSWVKVVSWASLTTSDELPLKVEIEAKGEDWGKSYLEYIKVKLDEEETQVRIELQTEIDITPLTLGIETLGGISTPVIECNTPIPVSKSQIFSTVVDNQTSARIHLLLGERVMAADNKTLGVFILSGIPPAPHGSPKIEITFNIDANGIFHIEAKDKETDKELEIKVTFSGGLSDVEIEVVKMDAQLHIEEDNRKRKSLSEAIIKI